eukprot:TRINITY_DN6544_c0_g1_i7.p1 TRINITY_DN6544_c0_g1~~TRINITY_DN6544_c0_g1_i7.p1  ORF type:complete len:358 (+),score=19.28 TRINITY_DN6544_c0_g1_i7:97-1074(+)
MCIRDRSTWDPPPLKSHTMVRFSKGVIIYGGNYWLITQSLSQIQTISDRDAYMDLCYLILTANNLTINDYTAQVWADMYTRTKDSCFLVDVSKFLIPKRILYSADAYIAYEKLSCDGSATPRGECLFGRMLCNNDYWGPHCENNICPNSLCYYTKESNEDMQCFFCSGHGTCSSNGECVCNAGYTGDDCSIAQCPNGCSNSLDQSVASCIQNFPDSQCRCNERSKRGADDCSFIFCLNECSGKGKCIEGVCKCDSSFIGPDCSIPLLRIDYGFTFAQSSQRRKEDDPQSRNWMQRNTGGDKKYARGKNQGRIGEEKPLLLSLIHI